MRLCSDTRAQDNSESIVSGSVVSGSVIDFKRDVVPILELRCVHCHQGDNAKAGFLIGDRDAVLGYVEPGDAASSLLWTDYLTAKPVLEVSSSQVMPPAGPLTEQELGVLKSWIDEGASWPQGVMLVRAKLPTENKNAEVDKNSSSPETFFDRAFGAIGYFHPAVVHFPIALLVFGGAAAGLSFFTGSRAQSIAFYCLLWGSLSAVLASILGWSFAAEKGYARWDFIPDASSLADTQLLFRHRWTGIAVAVLSVITLCLAIIARKYPNRPIRHIWKLGMLILAVLVSITGHQGGELVYGDILEKAVSRFVGK